MTDDFNPFNVLHIPLDAGRRIHAAHISLVMGTVIVIAVLAVAAAEGTLGSIEDLHPGRDLARVIGTSNEPGSQNFPVLRDVASWALAAIVVATGGVVWRQWQIFSVCLKGLAQTGVLRERSQPHYGRLHRLLGYHRVAPGGDFGTFIRRTNAVLNTVGYVAVGVAVISFILALLLVRSYDSLGVFRLWNVDASGLSDAEFARQSYDAWWASQENYGGFVVYLAISVVAIFVILLQNVVGLVAVYLIGGLPVFCEFEIDWFDRDRSFGFRPLGQAFRTVRWSLVMHGVALTTVFAIVGASAWAYTVPLLLLWLFVIPLYLGVPAMVFHGVAAKAKDAALARVARDNGGDDVLLASSAVPFIRAAVVRPLRVTRLGIYAFSGSVLLPIALTIAQIMGT